MNQIVAKKIFNDQVFELVIHAPQIAKKAQAGQFCILMTAENGERVPFTLADWDKTTGNIQATGVMNMVMILPIR